MMKHSSPVLEAFTINFLRQIGRCLVSLSTGLCVHPEIAPQFSSVYFSSPFPSQFVAQILLHITLLSSGPWYAKSFFLIPTETPLPFLLYCNYSIVIFRDMHTRIIQVVRYPDTKYIPLLSILNRIYTMRFCYVCNLLNSSQCSVLLCNISEYIFQCLIK